MKKVWIFSALLLAGLGLSQAMPALMGPLRAGAEHLVASVTMIGLAFIMIHVGYEFDIDKKRVGDFAWDYVVAMTAAAFPWVFVTGYFLYIMLPPEAWSSWDAWTQTLLAGRFAAPTSAGVLFAMLAAAGLSATWMFRKARVLAIFDDLDTILLMIPLQMMMVGWAWQLGAVVVVMVVMLWMAWHWLNRVVIPCTWPWVLMYAVVITVFSELLYFGSIAIDKSVPLHLEVLLPAFVLGCMMKPLDDPHRDDIREGHQEGPGSPKEQKVAGIVSGTFMFFVGLSMPALFGPPADDAMPKAVQDSILAAQPVPSWWVIGWHVMMVTVLSNVGKLFPFFCYRREAHWRERLAVAVGMWPRGEVGAGILVLSLGYGLGGPVLTVAMLSLALNLALTGVFILIVRRLLKSDGKVLGLIGPREATAC